MLRSLTLILIFAATLPAQLAPQNLWTGGFGHSGPVGQRGAVRDSAGTLYCMVIDRIGGSQDALTLLRSQDGGQTWAVWLAPINDTTSGLTGSNRANQSVIAVDDQDRLHVSWQRAWYPSDYEQYYRNVDLATGAMSPILNVNTLLGVPTTARSNAQALHVAADGRVWMTGPTGTNWQETLLVSNQPYAAGNGFTNLGNVAPSGQGQNTRIAIDASGVIHTIYYSSAQVRHRSYDPASGTWSSFFSVAPHGGGSMARAFDLRADALGGIHVVAMINTTAYTGTTTPAVRYRYRDPGSGWTTPIDVLTWSQAEITAANGNLNDMRVAGLAVNEISGDAFIAARDFGLAGGALVILRKAAGEATFHRTATLTAPSTGQNDYHAPYFVGHENPGTAYTLSDLQVFWRQGATGTQYSAWHAAHPGAPLAAAVQLGTGCAGTSGSPLTLSSPPPILGDSTWSASVTGGPPMGTATVYTTPTPGPAAISIGGGCSIYLDFANVVLSNPTAGPLPLDASGALTIPLPIPSAPSLAGMRITAQAIAPDPGANSVNLVLSNALDLFFGF